MKNFIINILVSLFLVLIINCSTNSDESDVSPSISPINYYHSLPVWSHDGNYIYYVMIPSGYFLPYTDEKTGIYRIKPDGTGKELLIELNRFSSSISRLDISSDNEWLVFDLNGQIHKYSTSTDSLVKLTFEGRNYFPSWKPDGTQIVYDSNLDSDSHYFLWTIDASGLNNKRIIYTPELGSVRMPYWGEFIYHKRRNDIYRMDEKGLNVRQITFNDSDERDIKYNSTSESLVFTISASVWTADKEGKNQKQLTDNLEGMYPSWSPDGEQIVYTYPVPQNGYLWIMDKDGKNRRQLTD